MKTEGLSIIVIAYNEENYLPWLLDSLINQTNDNFEVIVVDSNSNDRTELIAKHFGGFFKEYKYIKLDRTNGPAYGRNKGAEKAKEHRLLFLDADTELEENFVEKALDKLDKKNIDVATCFVRIAEGRMAANMGSAFLNFMMFILNPFYTSAYGACLFSTREVHVYVNGFNEDIVVCEDCNYVKKARGLYKFRILKQKFYTSDRRANTEGGFRFMMKYIKIHAYRIFTGKELLRGSIEYSYDY